MTGSVVAIDLGASSGRVILGHVGRNELKLTHLSRFGNIPVRLPDGLHWDVLEMYRNVLTGTAAAVRADPDVRSVAVDSWACDYALLRNGRLLGIPFHYRDERNAAAARSVHSRVSPAQLYAANGLQYLVFNTLYQFEAERTGDLDRADGFLLLPDLMNYWLTGRRFGELTNASTTGLLNVTSREWDEGLIRRLGIPLCIFPELIEPGSIVGGLLPSASSGIGASSRFTVNSAGSHDTASAVVAVPAPTEDSAYISCGTWSLVGVELEQPIVTEEGRRLGFTNEGGVDGRIRYLHNVMGLWLLNECVRSWEARGERVDLPRLLREAAEATDRIAVFDTDDARFLAAGDMPSRIAALCSEQDLPIPDSRAAFVRSILESLSSAYVRSLDRLRILTGKAITTVHIVGGGSQNELLCQLTADRAGLPVLAGPVEATAIGNILVQARTDGLIAGSLESLRALVAAASPPRVYRPRSHSRPGHGPVELAPVAHPRSGKER